MGVFQSISRNTLASIFDPLWAWFTNLGNALSGFIGRMLYYLIVCGVGRICDICQLLFKKFAGISESGMNVGTENKKGDIVIAFLESSIVRNLFFSLLILAVIILLITTFAAVIKTEFNKDGNNNKKKVIKNAFRGLVNFAVVPIICVFGLFIGNALLNAINGATSSSSVMLSNQVFIAGAYNANRARSGQIEGNENQRYETGSFGALLAGTSGTDANGYANFGIFLDDISGQNPRRAADKIDLCFSSGYAIKVSQGLIKGNDYTPNEVSAKIENDSKLPRTDSTSNSNTIDYSKTDFWNDGMMIHALYIPYQDESGIHNSYVTSKITFKEGDVINFTIFNVGLVYYYYDLALSGFNYVISTVALIFSAWILLTTVLGLIKRIFMASALFIISPPICALYPLDEGAALGRWRAAFVKEALSAYSIVVIMNIFLMLLPLFQNIVVFTSGELSFMTGFANYMAQVLIVLAGLSFFKSATKTVSDIIGAGDASGDGGNAVKGFTSGVKRTVAGAALGAGLVIGAGKFAGKTISGSKNAIANSVEKSRQKKDDKFAAAHADALAQAGIGAGTPNNDSSMSMNSKSTSDSGSSTPPVENVGTNGADNVSGEAKPDGNNVNVRSLRKTFEAQQKENEKREAYDKKKGAGKYDEKMQKKEKKREGRRQTFQAFKIATGNLGIVKAGKAVGKVGKVVAKGTAWLGGKTIWASKNLWKATKFVGKTAKDSFAGTIPTANYILSGEDKKKPKLRDSANLQKRDKSKGKK